MASILLTNALLPLASADVADAAVASLPKLLGLAWLLPLASFVAILFFGPRMGPHGRNAAWLATAAIVASFVLSLIPWPDTSSAAMPPKATPPKDMSPKATSLRNMVSTPRRCRRSQATGTRSTRQGG
jgi:hypothetical protein